MKTRSKGVILATCCALGLSGGWCAWRVYHFLAFGIDNAYAQWGAGDLVVDYMEKHEGRWPTGWEDLRLPFQAGRGRVAGWSFDEYRSRIAIRWDVDPAALLTASSRSDAPPFDVIHPADGIDAAIGGRRGNEILYRYL